MSDAQLQTCQHYKRPIAILANCCQKWFSCHVCHNEQSDHDIIRSETKRIKCLECNTEQDISNQCINKDCYLSGQLCYYYCNICCLHVDDPTKDIYHCDKCTICRIGKKDEMFHCEKCNACYNKLNMDTHSCSSKRYDDKCPICCESVFHSRTGLVPLKNCTHAMCGKCYEDYTTKFFICPLCKKSLFDMSSTWEMMDVAMTENQMPQEYENSRADIICNDCNQKSYGLKYHFLHHKCQQSLCGSYNTNIIQTHNIPGHRRPTSPNNNLPDNTR